MAAVSLARKRSKFFVTKVDCKIVFLCDVIFLSVVRRYGIEN